MVVGLVLRRGVVLAVALLLGPGTARLALAATDPPTSPPPAAANDTFPGTEDAALIVSAPGVLANDNPIPGTCVTSVDSTGLAGTLTMNPDGSFTYAPASNFNGQTSFSYAIRMAGDLQCAGPADGQAATVTITVAPVNDAPTATADSFIVLKDRTLNVGVPGVLINDHDVDGDALTAVKVTNPAHGVVVLASDGSFSYTPSSGYIGLDAFSYKASDGSLASPIRVVSLTVTAVPPVPTPTPIPTPTPEPTATPEPTPPAPSPTSEPSVSIPPSPSAKPSIAPSVVPSAARSPTPGATAVPAPTGGNGGGISLPVLLVIVLFVLLVGFGAAVYLPKWLASQRGEPFDPGGP